MKSVLKIFIKIFRNKFILTLLVFSVWLLIFDRNNLIDRGKYLHALDEMEAQKIYYIEKIRHDSARLNELKTDADNLEKFAREQYLMKKENEEIFVITDED
jgi:cell division protein DivIC